MAYADIFPSFTTSQEHPWLAEARTGLEVALGRGVEVDIWPFATDGGHFAGASATVLGFGPGNDSVVHTVEERLPLDQLVESVVGYIALGLL
jgi:acetylornithine deacetylase/succinyl-diaminopimelate desuccinylase-like protein